MTQILIADDETSIRTILSRAMEKKGFQVHRARTGEEALAYLKTYPIDLAFLDIRMPDMNGLDLLNQQKSFISHPFLFVITAQDTMENAVEAMKRGAYDYITKPFDLDEISLLVDRALETRRLQTEVRFMKTEGVQDPLSAFTLVGKSRAIQEIYKMIGKVANQDVTVLLTGESGTGKELVAKAVHYKGNRAPYPFVVVNCSAIPRELLESELFGYKKGAFTGAVRDKPGFFEQAHLGTLFLDEIGDLPTSLQAKLLRVLQDKEVQRVGDTKTFSVNVRIVAATNRDLNDRVKRGEFREDLFFRLNVVPIHLPPLRERRSDLPLLVDYFLNQRRDEIVKKVSNEALDFLKSYHWPGNVRELENIIKRAVVLSQGPVLEKRDFEILLQKSHGELLSFRVEDSSLEELIYKKLEVFFAQHKGEHLTNLHGQFLPSLEKPLIRLALLYTKGNQLKAADLLGVNRNTLRKKMRELNVS